MNRGFGATAFTGGGDEALDAIDGSLINVGDVGFVGRDDGIYHYTVRATGAAENSPRVIKPDINAGNKRWHLTSITILTSNLEQDDGYHIATDKIIARDEDGLYLVNSTDNGIFISSGAGIIVDESMLVLNNITVSGGSLAVSGGGIRTTGESYINNKLAIKHQTPVADLDVNGSFALENGNSVNKIVNSVTASAASSQNLVTELGIKTFISENMRNGTTSISSGVSAVSPTLTPAFSGTNYTVVSNLVNTTDVDPSIYGHIITNKTVSGFTAKFSGTMDTANYKLEWIATD